MTIFAEIIDERVELTDSYTLGAYRINLLTFISCVASEPYRRGESNRWFTCPRRPTLTELNGRPC